MTKCKLRGGVKGASKQKYIKQVLEIFLQWNISYIDLACCKQHKQISLGGAQPNKIPFRNKEVANSICILYFKQVLLIPQQHIIFLTCFLCNRHWTEHGSLKCIRTVNVNVNFIIWPFHSSISTHTHIWITSNALGIIITTCFKLVPSPSYHQCYRTNTATKKANPHKIHLITTAQCTAVYNLTFTKKSTLLQLFKKKLICKRKLLTFLTITQMSHISWVAVIFIRCNSPAIYTICFWPKVTQRIFSYEHFVRLGIFLGVIPMMFHGEGHYSHMSSTYLT
jgi:hypothetical protein